MTTLVVEQARSLALLQDAGRFGARHLGVTQGGAFDWVSMRWANWLLGNSLDAVAVEILLGGFTLRCESDGWLALAGADLQARLDGEALRPWHAFAVRAGQQLDFTQARLGARAYLAAPGGFACEQTLGSAATVVREGLGGLDGQGRPLQAGDRLRAGSLGTRRQLPAAQVPDLASRQPLDLVVGAQVAGFSGRSLYEAFNVEWTVDSRSDRMGVRLSGPRLHHCHRALASEAIPLGAVQVPPDGQPIVLANDCQTIGGYPRLGALTPASLARLGQCLPGTRVRLRPVGQGAAEAAHRRLLARWR